MQAPSQGTKGQPQAGLAALAQPAQAPRGMPSGNMQQIMSLAKGMSDAQLADVLSGKSMNIPQYVAMTEAMGRKSLRNAVQGQQAMAQAKQPSIKDKFLTEEAQEQMAQMMAQAPQMGGRGISALPAPNMDSMDMAGGGIIAFDEGGPVTKEELEAQYEAWQASKGPWYLPTPKGSGAKEKEAAYVDMLKKYQATQGMVIPPKAPAASATALPPAPTGAQPDALGRFVAGDQPPPAAAPAQAPVTGIGTAPGAQPYSIPSFESLQKNKSSDYLSKLEGLSDKQRAGIAQLKKEGGGEALMQMAAAVMGSPNLAQAAAKGLPMVASTSAATRKEARAVENLANDYDLNVAKAREAAEKGDMALALQYQQLANQAKAQGDTASYQQGMLGIHQGRNAMLQGQYDAVKIPGQLSKLYADATKEVKDVYGGMVPPSKQKQYTADIDKAYRKRAQAVGLGKYLDMYSPGATNPGFNLVQSLPKGAKIFDPFAED